MEDVRDTKLLELHPLTEAEVSVSPEGNVVEVTIIEAGPGNARDRHYYSAEVLSRDYGRYTGARMFKDHETIKDRRERGGLPRSVDQLAGVIQEAWWDPTRGPHGAVRGRAALVDDKMVTIARVAPSLLGVSHDAKGRSKPGRVGGQPFHMVEGIDEVNSVDIVSLAGARGVVDRIIEAHMEADMEGPLGTLTLDDVKEHRPDLLEAYAAEVAPKGTEAKGGEDKNTVSPDELREAVQSAVDEATEKLTEAHQRDLQIRDNRLVVAAVLSESDLPEPSRAVISRQFHDATFTEAEVDGEAVTPEAQLREALQSAIKDKKDELAAATGAGNVRGMGGSSFTEGAAPATKSRRQGAHESVMGQILR